MAAPASLTIDGARTTRARERLFDMPSWPVTVRTRTRAVSGLLTFRNDTLHLAPLDFDHPGAEGALEEPGAVRLVDAVEVTVLRQGA